MVKKQPILGHHQKPPQTPPQPSPPSSGNKATTSSAFTRSFGVYFPRASAQVQPRPPDLTTTVSDLLRLVEDLRDREYRLKTELLEHKLLRESVAIVPLLESQIACKAGELQSVGKRIEKLLAENESLLHENELLKGKLEEERREREKTVGDLEAEVVNLRHKLRMKEIEAEEMVSSCSKTTMSSSHLSRNLSTRKTTTARSTEVSVSVSSTGSSSSHNVDALMKGAAMDVVESKRAEQGEESESRPRDSCSGSCSEELPETSESAISAVRSCSPRVPKPPPMKRSNSSSSITASDRKSADCATSIPPPPPPFSFKAAAPPPPPPPPRRPVRSPEKAAGSQPPPPPPLPAKGMKAGQQPKVKRVPEVVEFYHSLMRRDSRRESGAGMAEVTAANTRDLVGEIENRSAHLLAIKTDVETQGDLIRFLIKEVENAVFTEIEDVVAFVKWLDDELSYLVDERAVLKHFDWPEQKADALREAAFEYSDLKKLEYEASSFKDNTRQACAPALKKMQALLEKIEHGVYNLSRLRESAANRFKALLIPVDWMLENGFVSQIKLASVKLAMKYMKRVSAELDSICGGPEEEELIVQGVRFAFRVHQFAGGFDIETMRAFQELRDRANSCRLQCQNQQQQQKLVWRSMSC